MGRCHGHDVVGLGGAAMLVFSNAAMLVFSLGIACHE
jgi:hypothetical protein